MTGPRPSSTPATPPATAAWPVVGHASTASTFAWRQGQPISVAQYLADAAALAATLPAHTHLINGCADAYQFCVGLLAAILRDQISVLPHNPVPRTLHDLADAYPGATMLIDERGEPPPIAWQRCPSTPAARASDDPAIPVVEADRTIAILFTSGSTGRAQALPRRWGTIVASARAEAQRLGLAASRPWAVLATGPAQHSYGFESAIWLPILAGGQIVAEHPFYPADVFAALAALPRPRLLVTAPVHLRTMVGSALDAPPADLLLSATAPLSAGLADEAERRFGAPLIEIYGSTETGQVASRRALGDGPWQTMPGVRVAQEADGRCSVAGGHVGDPMPLADRLTVIDDEHFHLLGRSADMIKVAGKRGSLREVELALLAIPGVEDAAVLAGDDDTRTNERLTGFVVAPSLDARAIVRALRDRLDPVFVPRPLVFVASLPRDGNGKLPRQRLVELANAQARRRAASMPTATAPATVPAAQSAPAVASAVPEGAVAPGGAPDAPRHARCRTPASGPMTDGHFPGWPVIPGARLLDLIVTTIGLPGGFTAPSVKFVEPVGPDESLRLDWQVDARGRFTFDCRTDDGRRVAHGTLQPL